MPIFTELNPTTALAYAHALAALFDLTVADTEPTIIDSEFYEYLLSDDTIAVIWFEFDHVYGEA